MTQSHNKQLSKILDGGIRHPSNAFLRRSLIFVPVLWAVFQLWFASPLPFITGIGIFNDTEARSIHLTFALFLAFTAYPFLRGNPTKTIPVIDIVIAILAALSASYLCINYENLAARSGAPSSVDIAFAAIGIITLLEATRRALGSTLLIIASIFLAYAFLGPYMPDVIAHKGASLEKLLSHQWLTTEGVFGVALGVSTSFVFLFVLLGALLEKAGAGNYFVRVAFSMLGHMVGGPAKAAVVSSGLSGIISGSSIANVVTTGTFTIPLMKKVGFPSHKAGAIEVAASTNGQLTPPIMGAAAFLMVEYVGISYLEVIKHAILPALISYMALIYIVHLEAKKAGMVGIPKRSVTPLAQKIMGFITSFIFLATLTALVYYGLGWTKNYFGDTSFYIWTLVLLITYIFLVKQASPYAHVNDEPMEADTQHLPEVNSTVKSGLYFLIPIFVLVWCLTVERFSPGLSAFYATCFMMFIVITHRLLLALFRKDRCLKSATKQSLVDLISGLSTGAQNMVAIGVATAAAGIIVGTVTLTGVGLVLTEVVELISGGNLILILILTAVMSLILGMGLPTTANYIVVSTLMAPIIVTLGAENGLIVPLIAVHMFVFYFGILADDTPPVGLAAYAASAIAKSHPLKTGIQGFTYDIRTAILPFMFIFNTELLLIGITSYHQLIITIVTAATGMLLFAAASQGFWLTRLKKVDIILLLALAFSFFRPDFWWDMIYPKFEQHDAMHLYKTIDTVSDNKPLRLQVSGENIDGKLVEKTIELNLSLKGSAQDRLEEYGLILREEKDNIFVDMVTFASEAERVGIDFDWQITGVKTYNNRPTEDWLFIPLYGLLYMLYRRHKKSLTT